MLWDLPEGPCQVIVTSDSPFEHGIDLQVRQYDPRFLDYGAGVGLLYHSDFDSDISQGNPARAGEVIVAYMTGLGPVDNNGLVSAGFQCRFDVTPVEVLYAGLALSDPAEHGAQGGPAGLPADFRLELFQRNRREMPFLPGRRRPHDSAAAGRQADAASGRRHAVIDLELRLPTGAAHSTRGKV